MPVLQVGVNDKKSKASLTRADVVVNAAAAGGKTYDSSADLNKLVLAMLAACTAPAAAGAGQLAEALVKQQVETVCDRSGNTGFQITRGFTGHST